MISSGRLDNFIARPDEPTPRRALVNAVALSAGAQLAARFANLVLSLILTLALSRYLGPTGYGDYIFVLGFVVLLSQLSDFGISKVAVREMARDPHEESVILGTSIVSRIGLALLGCCLAQGLAWGLGLRTDLRAIIAIGSLLCVCDALLGIGAIFQVRIAAQYEAIVNAVAQLLETVAALVLIAAGAGLAAIVGAAVGARLASVVLAWVIARDRFAAAPVIDLARIPSLVRESAPVGITLALSIVYLRLDAVLLGIMSTPTDVGLYGAAYKLVEYPVLGLSVITGPMFPLLARWALGDEQQFRRASRAGIDVMLAIALPIAVLCLLVGEPLVRLIYPPEFTASANALAVLGFALVLIVHNGWQGSCLLSARHQRATLAYDAAGLIVNIVLNVGLIGRFGFMGAAWAALGTSIFIALCSSLAASRLMGVPLVSSRLAGSVAANALLASVLWALLSVGAPSLLAVVGALASYPAWLFLFRVARWVELRAFLPSNLGFAATARGVV